MAQHVVQRRREIGVAEALGDDAVDVRDLAVHGLPAVDAHDRADADGRIERGPEMELVRRVGRALGGDDAAERCGHESSNASARDESAAESQK